VSPTVRNVGIVLLLALAVFALPGGGTGAAIVSALISIAFGVAIWFFLMRMYREHRTTLFGLGDKYRGIFYASLASVLFLGAAAGKWWDSGALTVLWIVLLGAAVYGFVATWRHWCAYD
jgi:predicted Co/Zn/Cd cation transporter (cation efflux family)